MSGVKTVANGRLNVALNLSSVKTQQRLSLGADNEVDKISFTEALWL